MADARDKPDDRADKERGQRATFDRRTGEVHGSGSGAGGSGNPAEDYDRDSKAGSGMKPTASPKIENADDDRSARPEGEAS